MKKIVLAALLGLVAGHFYPQTMAVLGPLMVGGALGVLIAEKLARRTL